MSKENNLTDFLTDLGSAIKDKRGIGSVNAQNFSTEIRAIEPLLDTLDITENGSHNVKDYKNVSVLVQSDELETIKTMLGEWNNSTNIKIPYGVEELGNSSLRRESGNYLMPYNVEYPTSIKKIGDKAGGSENDYNGTLEQWIKIPKGNLNTSNDTYDGFTKSINPILKLLNENGVYQKVILNDYVIPNSIIVLEQGALSCIQWNPSGQEKTLYINSNITELWRGCFYAIKGFKEILFSDDCVITNIENDSHSKYGYFFSKAVNLQKVKLPKMNILPNNSFNACGSLIEVVMPEELTIIGEKCFYNCTKLNELIIPKNVTEIKSQVFYRIAGNIVMESSTPCTIASSTFSNFNNKIYVPKGSRETYISATNWSSQASKIYEKYVVVFNIPTALVNNEAITYSIDGGKTYQPFTNGTLSLQEVATIKIKSTDSTQTILIGTTSGGNDVGTISNSELTFSFTTDTNVYLTIQ